MKMIDKTNQRQNSTLLELKARIEARRALKNDSTASPEPFIKPKREIRAVSEITIPEQEDGEFSLERYTELAHRVDICYSNYLTRLEELEEQVRAFEFKGLKEKTNEFEFSLKETAKAFEDMVAESLKPRFA